MLCGVINSRLCFLRTALRCGQRPKKGGCLCHVHSEDAARPGLTQQNTPWARPVPSSYPVVPSRAPRPCSVACKRKESSREAGELQRAGERVPCGVATPLPPFPIPGVKGCGEHPI